MTKVNKSRGNLDELEILKEIVLEDKYLLEEVLEKIRVNLRMSSKGFYDSIPGNGNKIDDKRKKVRDI